MNNDSEACGPLFPFFQSVNSALTAESNAVYTTVSENDPYVNGTPGPNQILRIPPPPSLPLPPTPTPTQPRLVDNLKTPWLSTGEQECIQQRELNNPGNTFYRYSIPMNAGYSTTPVYSAPIWVAGTMDPVLMGRFYGDHHHHPTTSQEHPQISQEAPERNGRANL